MEAEGKISNVKAQNPNDKYLMTDTSHEHEPRRRNLGARTRSFNAVCHPRSSVLIITSTDTDHGSAIRTLSEREFGKGALSANVYFFVLTVPAFVEKAVVRERSLLEKWGTHRG